MLEPLNLSDLAIGVDAEVVAVHLLDADDLAAEDRDVLLRLIEIGFVPGEKVRVIAHGFPGREPVAVRVGSTTFALRRFEAELIRVQPLASLHGAAATGGVQ